MRLVSSKGSRFLLRRPHHDLPQQTLAWTRIFPEIFVLMQLSNNPDTKKELQSAAVTFADIEAARRRMAGTLDVTPLAGSDYISRAWDNHIFFKLENLQSTGSFKERGALNKMLSLSDAERARGVITASAGNHGQAVAFHARRLGIPATVVMPIHTPLIKTQNTAANGARVILHGANFDESAAHAHEVCAAENLVYVHGFDDPLVIAGQGTLGLEMLEQCPYLEYVVIPIGGGGLAAGVGLAMKETNPRIRIIGVQTESIPSMKVALERGAPETLPPRQTIADGIAVRTVGSLTFELVRRYVDEIVTVNEAEIANAILLMLEREKTLVEGAGVVGVAALHNGHIKVSGRKIACILSGGNIDVNVLSRIIDKGLVKDGRLVKLRVLVSDYPGQLSRILSVVAERRANVLEINHNRALSTAEVGETLIDLVLETRGADHISEIVKALTDSGHRVNQETY
jgi:threonine dehydratase